jgi:hypothetical protein
MNRKLLIMVVLTVLISMISFSSAHAYTGATGNVIDSATLNGWTFGGDVYLVNNTDNCILGTAYLEANGTFTITNLVTNDLGSTLCSSSPGGNNTIVVLIDFTCAISTDCNGLGPSPQGPPGTHSDCSFLEISVASFNFSCGYIRTGTGPSHCPFTGHDCCAG